MAGSGGSGGGSVGGGGSSGGGGFGGGNFGGNHFHDSGYMHTPGHSGTRRGRPGKFPIGIIIIIIIIFGEIFLSNDFDNSIFSSNITINQEVSEEIYDKDYEDYTIVYKDGLSSKLCIPIDEYITDETSDSSYSEEDTNLYYALKEFYTKTGIQPHVYFIDYTYDDLYDYSLDLYYDLFEDEGHLLLCFACDGYDYTYQLIIGDDTQEILDYDGLETLNTNIEDKMYEAEEGSYYGIMECLSDVFIESAEEIMAQVVPIENEGETAYVSLNPSDDVSDTTSPTESVSQESTSQVVTEDFIDDFIENEFGNTDDEDDFLNGVFSAIKESGTNSNMFHIVLLAIALILFTVIAVIISKKHNNYEPDTFETGEKSNQDFDDYFNNYDSNSENSEDDQDYE